jgi:hypothetical protein
MNTISKMAGALLLGIGAAGLSGCATGLSTQVSRHQAMPAPAGQSFYVVPAEGVARNAEFNRYAAYVARQLEAKGYAPAGAPQLATMLVKLDYGVDEGQTRTASDPMGRSRYGYGGSGYADPFYRSRFGYYDPFYRGGGYGYRDPFYRGGYGYRDPFYDPIGSYYGRPYWSRFGYWGASRSPFYYGWDDPFWYASPYAGYGREYGAPIREYTEYKAHLNLDIVRRGDNAPLFQGHAKARAQTDELGVLVPNLIEAMFTGFPGRSGETVKITVPGRKS